MRNATPSRHQWTTVEVRVLRELYPTGGINAVIEQLPRRSRAAIYNHARAAGLRCAGQPQVRASWPADPTIDEAIRVAHQCVMQRGAVVKLAARIGRPVWWTSRRARDLGLTTPRFRELTWCTAEIDVLKRTAHLAPQAVQRGLKYAGFRRTTTAISVQRKRQGITRQKGEDYSCRQAADMLGADAGTLMREIRMGYLQAKPHPDYKPRSDGQTTQYVITERDLRSYIVNHPVRLNLRKLPAGHVPWFIDLVSGAVTIQNREAP
ncbi:MAG: hypothetical protein ABI114_00455 [Rhodanobacter sp.]